MKSIRVRNLRSLKDTDEIEIKRINILVGTNSSGKSTFLRVFPLLKQSFNKKIKGPILWCGDDDDYVDFGSFEEAVNYGVKDKCIKLTFAADVNLERSYEYRINRRKRKTRELETARLEISIKNSKETGYDYISQIQLIFRNNIVIVNFSEENEIKNVCINNHEIILDYEKKEEVFFSFYYEHPLFDISLYPLRYCAEKNIRQFFELEDDIDDGNRMFENYVLYLYYCRMLKEDIKIKNIEKVKRDIERLDKKDYEKLERWVLLYYLPDYFQVISNYIRTYFRKVYYIAPVRATAERYYRLRNAAVNEVDCRGKNLPVFLNSLSNKNFAQFQNWTKENLGFEVMKTTSEGHVSLKIRRKNQEKSVNLSDTGFGYSQILPIVTQLWYIEEENNLPFKAVDNDIPTTMVIEQPELHLHPGLQAKLIDIIAKVAKQGKVNFIIETHSETMINRIGHIIANGGIKNDDVGITIFEKEAGNNSTLVKKGGYDEEGYSENWPLGFFEPEED